MATRPESRLQQSLSEITRLLDRHRVLEALAHQQDSPKRDLVEHYSIARTWPNWASACG